MYQRRQAPCGGRRPDQMEWELIKENFQPLKRGRDPDTIIEASPAPTPAKTALEQRRRDFWKEIAEYEGPDPLEPWLRFIKWTQTTFSSGGHQAALMPLLERCTRELQQLQRYNNDIRYLRVWIQYADCLPEPRDVFTFLKENGIGQDFALFYIAYAAYLELRGNFAKAEAVFQAGLEKMAIPVPKLRAKYEDFQERMERRRLRKAQDGEGLSMAQDEASASSREALGVLRARGRDRAVRRPAAGSHARTDVSGVAAARPRPIPAAVNKENSEAQGLEVFVDDEFQGSTAAAAPDYGLGTQRTLGAWDKLSGFETTRKENEHRSSKWKGSKFKQTKALMPQPDGMLDIPEDEELKDIAPVIAKPPKGTLRQRLEASAHHPLDEELQHDPLRLFKDPALSASKEQKPARRERPAHDLEHAVGPSGEEISFEEVRARSSTAKHPLPPRPASPRRSDHISVSKTPNADSRTASGSEDAAAGPSSDQGSPVFSTLNAGRTGPLNFGKPPLPGPGQHGAPSASTSDVTINTQAAFESVNGMFKGALPQDFMWGSGDATQTVRMPEPTVTISTRAAFDAVNSMFRTALPHEAQRKDRSQQLKDRGRVDSKQGADPGAKENQAETFAIYEDTDLLPSASRAAAAKASKQKEDQTEGFAVYEDTEFLPDGKPGVEQTEAFGVYEDTEFLTSRKPASGDQTLGFQVYEDTDFRIGREG